MKLLTKAALGALAVASLAVGAAQPADARVVVGVGIGVGPVAVGIGPWGYASTCGAYWYQPVYFGGAWYQGPFCSRYSHGSRAFWINGGWRFNAWRGPWPHHFWWGRHGFIGARGGWAHFHHGRFDRGWGAHGHVGHVGPHGHMHGGRHEGHGGPHGHGPHAGHMGPHGHMHGGRHEGHGGPHGHGPRAHGGHGGHGGHGRHH